MYGSEIMLWKGKERSRVRTVQMENFRGLLGIKRMGRVPNTWTRELCGLKKGLEEKIDEGVLRWFGHVEKMERDRIGSSSVGRPRKRWIDTMKECLKKRGLDVRQARRMVQDRSEWLEFVRVECMGHSPGDEPLTLTR